MLRTHLCFARQLVFTPRVSKDELSKVTGCMNSWILNTTQLRLPLVCYWGSITGTSPSALVFSLTKLNCNWSKSLWWYDGVDVTYYSVQLSSSWKVGEIPHWNTFRGILIGLKLDLWHLCPLLSFWFLNLLALVFKHACLACDYFKVCNF